MSSDKEALITVFNTSVKELQQGIAQHSSLVNAILAEQVDACTLQPLLDRCPKRSREVQLEKTIQNAIEVLEETRKAFKSKKLELLRKELTRALMAVD
jgi:hypothetical protein